ncbi:riboflavin synthase subunit alpha [Thiohalorhabdus denitrificans]|uniref:Riboflavin synthase n=1 Tax=Thiohalorhabdus denitrificans TaxID=381306 RepID=A0A0P9CCG2_9GAMM|nr:riboflavin synthase [Thiohalorhabdus denitrificans]KPV40576.1 riboflavin synthase subunit alpha [Thiohalorhabdus denitrificans]SCY50687.1 riboflavin synthase alpha chain [Thiohalorhabdus denitrificans]
MFTGIIQAVGTVRSIQPAAGDWRVAIRAGGLELGDVALGDSIAVSGPCLTVVALEEGGFAADVSVETWERTAFGDLTVGSRVNLEKALLPTTRLGGHLVSGHVDGLAVLQERRQEARSERFVLEVPAHLSRYVAEKGSVCLDGVSLTVNGVEGNRFDVNLVPHTLAHTTLGDRHPGDRLNLEVDLIARYLERLVRGEDASGEGGGLDAASLARAGFSGLGEGG